MNVAIRVHNLGTNEVSVARVVAVLTASGAEVARKEFTTAVPAAGVAELEWSLTTPSGTPLVATVKTSCDGDANPANNEAHVTAGGKLAPKTMIRPTARATP